MSSSKGSPQTHERHAGAMAVLGIAGVVLAVVLFADLAGNESRRLEVFYGILALGAAIACFWGSVIEHRQARGSHEPGGPKK